MSKFIELTSSQSNIKMYFSVSSIRYVVDNEDYCTIVTGSGNTYPSLVNVAEKYKEVIDLING